MRYSTEWKDTITRLGRWIDFENDYKTMQPSFMESVWWVFKQLFEKGLVYRGYKVREPGRRRRLCCCFCFICLRCFAFQALGSA